MLGWVITLGLSALIAGVLGFVALAGVFAFVAKLLFLILLALLAMSIVSWLMQGQSVHGGARRAEQ
jgi:uncharacterized membrane protein YtjA (UPF0391 family)